MTYVSETAARWCGRRLAKAVAVSQPAAGAEWSWTPGYPVEVLAVRARFVASVAVANRFPAVQFREQGGGVLAVVSLQAAIAASGGGFMTLARAGVFQAPSSEYMMPLPLWELPDGGSIKTSTLNLQAADQWSAVYVTYRLLDD